MPNTRFSREIILYGLGSAALILVMEWAKFRFVIVSYRFEAYAGILAVVFTALGIWMAGKVARPKTTIVVVREPLPAIFERDGKTVESLGISRRELEVLELMAAGLSNNEIAEKLFISPNTVKTHSSTLYAKLDVRRRTQAVETGKKLRLIA